ncbi:hypothetical protein FTO70_06195 [Methanosarcina sp. KYL-1]|uniref:hypothetical protein n=1 Tax=Methanosarcina sp. KYL-1 TaxID=2602068 RepID=UPI002101A367|nr:hypothetical protein [Methanosarcina sp. KYL-1]MCQ1535287.1 hypothetical protein [Methanosarcina sp. KYL-1]
MERKIRAKQNLNIETDINAGYEKKVSKRSGVSLWLVPHLAGRQKLCGNLSHLIPTGAAEKSGLSHKPFFTNSRMFLAKEFREREKPASLFFN